MNDDNIESGPKAARSPRKRTVAVAAAVGVAGLLAGGLAAGASSAASADSGSGGYGGSQGYGGRPPGGQNADPSKPMRADEKLLTGETKQKVLAAVEAKYPDASIQRVETDSDGVYEAHVLNGGEPMIVQVGKDFTLTGTQSGGPGGGDRGGPAGPGASSNEDSSFRQS
jgi:hypothetical protein